MKTTLLSLLLLFANALFAQTLGLTSFATGFSDPVEIVNAGDNRLFVVEQGGTIKIVSATGTVTTTPFLNISTLISTGGERGLLGLAFHPDYANNGYFYVNYTNTSGHTVIARYSVNTSNPNLAQTPGTILLTINQPFSNHNGGTIKFGPDGYLYIGMGDGGSGGDPNGYGQNINSLLGKMLRIDVDGTAPYTSPATNPYVGVAGADEIWAIGLRNPWKFSFDSLNGDLWIADVGQQNVEEINKEPYTSAGLNYGWKCYEGSAPYATSGCAPIGTMTFPYAEYSSATGSPYCSITGGYVYRGNTYPAMQGKYFFADYCSNKIGKVETDGTLTFSPTMPGGSYTSFGVDINGEIYVASADNGVVYKLVDTNPLSVKETELKKFKMYPNPAKETLYLSDIDFPATVSIYDITGKLLIDAKIESNQTAINTSGLESGIYMVNVTDNAGGNATSKLAVK
ncbi:glucose/arabinose dehydrogenase [Flavobacterium arsenatis]|uniref:Glucose/arabinose dehydrogenase n=1 Tax=Flavobacterium arsenatis TaxID=1484332 RepID=A0ABU1TLA0_9FLAO|nr:PQQ-dependent sugar dehydrogenase [Flavobacterium arsenatis]MDR6966710.1 glucose/arabinose dehydrogenase [Flavobacterium arsenatis]